MQLGKATLCVMTKNCCTTIEMWQANGLSECCTVFRDLWGEWHSYKLSEIHNKFHNSLSVLQAQTVPNYPKVHSFWFMLCKYKSIGCSYLEISNSPDSVWSVTPLVESVFKENKVKERLSSCGGTTYGHHINCGVRAVLHGEHSVWYSKQVWLSELYNTAYKGERTERELRLTVVLRVFPHCLINGTISDKKLLKIKCMFWFSKQNLFEMFLILGKAQWDITINTLRSSCIIPDSLVRF